MNKLFVSALPFKCNEDMIREFFSAFGKIGSIEVFADWKNPTFEPYASIEIEKFEEAILALDGKKVGSTHLRVQEWR